MRLGCEKDMKGDQERSFQKEGTIPAKALKEDRAWQTEVNKGQCKLEGVKGMWQREGLGRQKGPDRAGLFKP